MIVIDSDESAKLSARILCDFCQQPITNAGLGVVIREERTFSKNCSPVLYAHKGPCHDAMEKKVGHTGWHELQNHLLQLLLFSGMTIEKLQETVNCSAISNGFDPPYSDDRPGDVESPLSNHAPPFNLEREQLVIAQSLECPHKYKFFSRHLISRDFYDARHSSIWHAMRCMSRDEMDIGLESVCEFIRSWDKGDDGDRSDVINCLQECVVDADTKYNRYFTCYQILMDSLSRRLIDVGAEFLKFGYSRDRSELEQFMQIQIRDIDDLKFRHDLFMREFFQNHLNLREK